MEIKDLSKEVSCLAAFSHWVQKDLFPVSLSVLRI